MDIVYPCLGEAQRCSISFSHDAPRLLEPSEEVKNDSSELAIYPDDFVQIFDRELPLYAEDPENNLKCYLTDSKKNPEIINEIREYIKKLYKRAGYDGFDDDHDRIFDHHSVYFVVFNSRNRILATTRFVKKTPNSYLPFELGVIDSGTVQKHRYVTEEYGAIDINSFCFSSLKGVKLILAAGTHYLLNTQVNKIYCMCDPHSKRIESLYLEMKWKYSPTYSKEIYFPGYGEGVALNKASQPTKWKVMEAASEEIMGNAYLLENFKFFTEP